MNEGDNIIALKRPQTHRPATRSVEDSIVAAVLNLKKQPIRQVNWPAVVTFLTISIVAMASAALVPTAADTAIRWPAAMGLMVSVLSAGMAALYRYAPIFWVRRMVGRRLLKAPKWLQTDPQRANRA